MFIRMSLLNVFTPLFLTTALFAQTADGLPDFEDNKSPVASSSSAALVVDQLSSANEVKPQEPVTKASVATQNTQDLKEKSKPAQTQEVEKKDAKVQDAQAAEAKDDNLTIIGVGDIMMGRNFPDDSPILPSKDGALIFSDVKDVLRDADVTVGNLEGVLLDKGGTSKSCSDPSACYVFRMPERYVKHLVDAGFDLLSIANNHAGDFGDVGRKSSQRVLKEAGLHYAGFEGMAETDFFVKDGVKYGFTAFSVNTGTLRHTDSERAKKIIAKLRKEADIVIVSMHIGAEGTKYTHVTRQQETCFGENRGNPYEFARLAIDAGADVVIGHGPHVIRAFDLYKGKFIAYSLGNFATSSGVNISGISGYAPIVKVTIDRKGNFVKGKLYSNVQGGNNGDRKPSPDKGKACVKEIKKLTEQDIPEAGIAIDLEGNITLK